MADFQPDNGAGETLKPSGPVDLEHGVGFFGTTPVTTAPTVSAAATDATTTETLANSLRTALIDLGLVSA